MLAGYPIWNRRNMSGEPDPCIVFLKRYHKSCHMQLFTHIAGQTFLFSMSYQISTECPVTCGNASILLYLCYLLCYGPLNTP